MNNGLRAFRHRGAPTRLIALVCGVGCAVVVAGCQNLDRYGPSEGAGALTPPPALRAAAASPSAISLTWNAPAGVSGTLTYRVYRGGSAVGTTQTRAYTDEGLAPSTTYTYTVAAVDQYGAVSPSSDPADATTMAVGQHDDAPPSVPQDLTAVPGSPTSISLAWSPSADDQGVLGYRVYRDGVEVALSAGTQYTDQGLSPARAYTYTVAAFDGTGNLSQRSEPATASTLSAGAMDAQTPTAPANLTAVPASTSAIGLTWSAATDDVGVLGYRIYRAGVEVGVAAGTSYSDGGLTSGTTYSYTVAAFDAAGHLSPMSNAASATTLSQGTADTDPPTTPGLVVAVPSGPTAITVSWSASSDNVGVLAYRVFRDGVQVATTPTLLYQDQGLTPATSYAYTVAAMDAAGNVSPPSAPVSATTLGTGASDDTPPSTPGGVTVSITTSTSVTLNWSASSDLVGVVGYLVFRDGVQVGSTVATTLTDQGLCSAVGYQYTVAAVDAAGNVSPQSAPLLATTVNVAVNLGSAAGFGVLAGAGVTVGGLLPSVIHGDVGSSPSLSLAGLPLLNLSGTLHLGDAAAAVAQVDLASAVAQVAAMPVCAGHDLTGQPLAGVTIHPGVSGFTSGVNLSGTVTLDAGGDPNAVFAIRVAGSLTVAAGSQVVLANGAQADHVFWLVGGSTTVGANADVKGSLVATSSISLASGAKVQGRVLSRTGSVGLVLSEVGL